MFVESSELLVYRRVRVRLDLDARIRWFTIFFYKDQIKPCLVKKTNQNTSSAILIQAAELRLRTATSAAWSPP
jgi:hypothetical protein